MITHAGSRAPRAGRTPGGGWRSSRLLVAFLLLTLGLTAVLAYQVQDAVRSHRETAEYALQDYARFAAFHFARQVKPALYDAVVEELIMAQKASAAQPASLPHPRQIAITERWRRVRAAECPSCRYIDDIEQYFLLDLRSKVRATTTGTPLPAGLERLLRDSLSRMVAPPQKAEFSYGAIFRTLDERAFGVGYYLQRDSLGVPLYAYGFTAPPAAFAPILHQIMAYGALLPPTLTDEAANDAMLHVTVSDAEGSLLYSSPREYESAFMGHDTTYSAVGHLNVVVALRPDAAGMLLIGGLPQSRLPLLVALLLVATLLVAASIVQLRRETELAALRSEFVSSVSHELRTPLAQIRMFAETLRLGRVRSEQERDRSIEIIDQEARRLAHLVENVLLFSRAERQQVQLRPETGALRPLLDSVMETFAPLAGARGVRVLLEAEADPVVHVDRGSIRQVLLNLLDNAVKYGPSGQTVRVGVQQRDGTARISVCDEGPGIPAAARERVFAPYWRLPRDSASAVAGGGIGLAVVRELVLQQGGRVAAEDAPGGGACMVVELPARTGYAHAAASDRITTGATA